MTTTTLSPSRRIHAALRFLAGVDDGAVSRDDVGFNGRDTGFGQSLAAQHTLSEVQLRKGLEMLRTYQFTQLEPNGHILPTDTELTAELTTMPVNSKGNRFVRVIDAPLTTDKAAPSTGMVNQPVATVYKGDKKNTIKVAFKVQDREEFSRLVQLMRDLGGKFNDDKTWTLGINNLHAVMKAISYAVVDDAVKDMHAKQTNALAHRLAVMDRLLEAAGDLDAPLPSGRTLFKHQKDAIPPMLTWHKVFPERTGYGIRDKMGLGKTTTTIMVAKAWQKATGCTVLVLSPPSVMGAWEKELAGAGLTENVVLASWGKVPKPLAGPYIFVADEAHRAQAGFSSSRGKAFIELARHENCLCTIPVTGTPHRNGRPVNVWPLLYAMRVKEAESKREFERIFCAAKQVEFIREDPKTGEKKMVSFWDNNGASNLDRLHALLKTCFIGREKGSADLPPKTIVTRQFKISPKMFKVMRERLLVLREQYNSRIADDTIKGGAEAIVLINHLRLAFSIAAVEEAVEVASDVLDEGRSVVVYTDFRQSLKMIAIHLAEELAGKKLPHLEALDGVPLSKTLTTYGVECLNGDIDPKNRPAMVERFQSGKSRVFVSTIKAGNEGITLTKASELIMVDRTFAPDDNLQAHGRIDRISQTLPTTIINLSASAMHEYMDAQAAKKEAINNKVMRGEITEEEAYRMRGDYTFDYKKGLEILDEIIGYKG